MRNEQKAGNITERVTIAAAELLDYIKHLIEAGSLRRLVIRKPSGDPLLDVPLIAGIAVSGALILVIPAIAALGAVAALVAKVQVDIIRGGNDEN